MGKTTTSPFPRGLNDDNFNNAQGVFVNAVVTNAVEWKILEDAVDELVAARAVYEPLYLKSQDKNIRTRADIAAHRLGRRQYEKKCRLFWNKWIEDNDEISPEDKLKAGGRLKDIEPSPKPVLTTAPIVGLKGLEGGKIEVRLRETKDQTRPSKPKAAKGVDAYFILTERGDIPPENPDKCPEKKFFSKAKFIIDAGAENSGKLFHGYFRWVNPSMPERNGPWTKDHKVIVP